MGRIRHLCEPLLEIAVEQTGFLGQRRYGRVIAHGEDRLLAFKDHSPKDKYDVFQSETKRPLRLDDFHLVVVAVGAVWAGYGTQPITLALDPLSIGFTASHFVLDLVIEQELSALGINRDHLARPQPTLAHDAGVIHLDDPDL